MGTGTTTQDVERTAWSARGVRVLLAGIASFATGGVLIGFGAAEGLWGSPGPAARAGAGIALVLVAGLAFAGLTAVVPGQARAVQLFGRYRGTIRVSGLHWVNPLAERRRISTRVRNHETTSAQVNDADGNPIEVAGVTITESRLTRLSYATEVAQAMPRVQQASAVVAARTQIVEGAVGMVELALHRLEERAVVDLDEERKAAMVSNLLVVLCSERATDPVINTGSLYQ